MPSLRKKFTSYIRQLSFHNEPRNKRNNINENAFVTKYLQGHIALHEGPQIIYGKNPTDLPNYELGKYESGADSIIGCYSGPNGGLTTVTRTEKHLSVLADDIDFIDTPEEEPVSPPKPKKSPIQVKGQPIDNTTMVIKVAGHEYCVTNKPKRHSKSFSLGSISDFAIEVEKTKIDKEFYHCDSQKDENSNDNSIYQESETKCDRNQFNVEYSDGLSSKINGKQSDIVGNNLTNINLTKDGSVSCKTEIQSNENKDVRSHNRASVKEGKSRKADTTKPTTHKTNNNTKIKVESKVTEKHPANKNYALSKSKSDGNPFHHKKRGKIIHMQRPQSYRDDDITEKIGSNVDDSALPSEWNIKTDSFYGLSDSLYDRNQVTKSKNGDPIADCFGLIARNDSAILAVADGVNWGEKASIAAKSAIHASLHYLNKTIFNDTKPFEKLTTKTDDISSTSSTINPDVNTSLMMNTREVFVCLLRAFNCAHDLILENKGMLTTLTVAVILPLKQKKSSRTENGIKLHHQENCYVCCVCNVGDTLAYVYSQKNGIRELTKGSHDVNSNRDMRDALGALGPVDGINPELSNLTLSVTTINKGDIIFVASDGLTDNFDPNVCRFTVNSTVDQSKNKVKRPMALHQQQDSSSTNHPSHQNSHELQSQVSLPTQSKGDDKVQKPPVKPPRKSKTRGSISSITPSERSSSSIESSKLAVNVQSGNVVDQNDRSINTQEGLINTTSFDLETENKPGTSLMSHQATSVKGDSLPDSKHSKSEYKKPPSVIENKASSLRKQVSSQSRNDSARKVTPPSNRIPKTLDINRTKQEPASYKFLKSKTSLDLRSSNPNKVQIIRNEDGIPYVTPIQRYELQLLLMEDILKNGISGHDAPITTAKKLCESLVSFTVSITSAKRHTLEDQDMYFDNRNGVLVEVSSQEKKLRRKRGLEKVQSLPGKLDHVTVVAYNVGNFAL
ncbi:PP2C-like domain-containing protein CG9801 isoform X2 [Sitophilus oryzae]|nr:PP2C-like domain-containing protein CG9801 isoform X2 [Sitophilus oryzae]